MLRSSLPSNVSRMFDKCLCFYFQSWRKNWNSFVFVPRFVCLFVCSTCIFQKLFLVLLNKDADRTPLLSLLNLFDCLNLFNFYKFQSNCPAFFSSLIGIFYNELVPFTPFLYLVAYWIVIYGGTEVTCVWLYLSCCTTY